MSTARGMLKAGALGVGRGNRPLPRRLPGGVLILALAGLALAWPGPGLASAWPWPGLAWPDAWAWPGLALAWPGLAWPCLAQVAQVDSWVGRRSALALS